jgi:hypothetical protein
MRKYFGLRPLVLLILAIMLIANWTGISDAAIAGEDDYCWNVRITQDETGPVTAPLMLVKLHIVPIGNGTTAIMNGRINIVGDAPFMLNGVAAVGATFITANLTSSQKHTTNGWRDTGVMQVNINNSTMNGTFYEVGNDFDSTNHVFGPHYASGTLITRTCP